MGSLAERCAVLRALPQGPLHGVPRREMPRSYSPPSFIFRSPRYTVILPEFRFPSPVKGSLWREMPILGDFLNISSRVSSKGAPTLVGSQSLERTLYRPSAHGEKQTHLCPWRNSHSDSSVIHFPYHFLRKITWRLPSSVLSGRLLWSDVHKARNPALWLLTRKVEILVARHEIKLKPQQDLANRLTDFWTQWCTLKTGNLSRSAIVRVCFWRENPPPTPQWASPSSFTRFLDNAERRTADGIFL